VAGPVTGDPLGSDQRRPISQVIGHGQRGLALFRYRQTLALGA